MKGHAETGVLERLQDVLRERGEPWSQTAIGALVGVKQGSVAEWRAGGPSLKHAQTIARKLNLSVEWIYTGRGPKHPGPPLEVAAQKLWSMWHRLDPDAKQQVIGFVSGMLHTTPTPTQAEPRASKRV